MSGAARPGTYLVTGASTGIGRSIVEHLAARGHLVFAGARKAADLQALGEIEHVHPVQLDVTRPSDIDAAMVAVQAQGRGLDGLVNNAGVGGLGLLHTWDDDGLQSLFDTNVSGPLRMSRACLPWLLATRGRIVHIGSMGGSITSPAFGPYTMSKHALEALAQCQRLELAPHGVAVSIVQPGGVATAIGDNSAPGTRARWQRAAGPFASLAQQVLADMAQPATFDESLPESAGNRRLAPPARVAEAVVHALLAPVPRARYLVGTRWEGDRVVSNLIERLLDANEGEAMHYSRDELVACLDAQIAARR